MHLEVGMPQWYLCKLLWSGESRERGFWVLAHLACFVFHGGGNNHKHIFNQCCCCGAPTQSSVYVLEVANNVWKTQLPIKNATFAAVHHEPSSEIEQFTLWATQHLPNILFSTVPHASWWNCQLTELMELQCIWPDYQQVCMVLWTFKTSSSFILVEHNMNLLMLCKTGTCIQFSPQSELIHHSTAERDASLLFTPQLSCTLFISKGSSCGLTLEPNYTIIPTQLNVLISFL